MRFSTRGATALAATLALLASGSVSFATAAERVATDDEVRKTVENEIQFDATVPLDDVEVTSSKGIVTLTGSVDNVLAKERVARIARTVKGVRGVVNRVTVLPRSTRTDGGIREDVHSALRRDPATDSYEVSAVVADGTVTLMGKVASWQEKNLSAVVAKSVRGVRDVVNEIEVDYSVDRSDAEIEAEIEKVLEYDVRVDHGMIGVSVDQAAVTLTGTVGSAAEKWRATTDAWVGGVEKVDNQKLAVARWARDDDLRRQKYAYRTDEDIEKAVGDALLRDPRVASFDVETRVERGHVTLSGTVNHLSAKRAAEQDARNVVGVYQVDNDIEVEPAVVLTDDRVRTDVLEALMRDSVVESYEIDVSADNYSVDLEGTVDTYYEKFHAEEVASRVPGVVTVDNRLVVDADELRSVHDPYVDEYYYPYGYTWFSESDTRRRTTSVRMTDAEIEEEVEDELWWSPFVDADEVDVSVSGGVVTLAGVVDSWAEASSAVENAYEGGARRVENELIVARFSS